MKKPPGTETEFSTAVRVLSISPVESDHESLTHIFTQSERAGGVDFRWAVFKSLTLESALATLQDVNISVVISECDLVPGTWKDVLAYLSLRPHAPPLIVTSRLADGYLWAEALNLGAYDVLAKPFHRTEVIRVAGAAWRYWTNQSGLAARAPKTANAASGM